MADKKVKIDLITEKPDRAIVLVLVEQGPWPDDALVADLRRVQERLYNCVDVAVDGHLAKQFPSSHGRPVVIRLDCYDTPDEPVREFVRRFAAHVVNDADLQRDLKAKGFVSSLEFEYHWRSLAGHG